MIQLPLVILTLSKYMILKKLSVCYKQNCWIGLGLLFLILFVLSACNLDKHKSKYAGQENREIKSLSPNDIEELQKGAGWGLDKENGNSKVFFSF